MRDAPPPAAAATATRVSLADPRLISDLHLSEHTPRTLRVFEHFVRHTLPPHADLVILGDLFEAWAGDDDDAPLARRVVHTLAAAVDRGSRLFVMHGNRDLLLGTRFAEQTGATLLADPCVAEVGGNAVLLAHGDSWCTDDAAYQQFRNQVRSPSWQAKLLAQPLAQRRAFIAQARAASESAKQMKSMDIMDVAPAAIDAAFRTHAVTTLIHGHTHRPATHRHVLDGVERTRLVLPDWDFDGAGAPRGGYLRWTGTDWAACALSADGTASAVSH